MPYRIPLLIRPHLSPHGFAHHKGTADLPNHDLIDLHGTQIQGLVSRTVLAGPYGAYTAPGLAR